MVNLPISTTLNQGIDLFFKHGQSFHKWKNKILWRPRLNLFTLQVFIILIIIAVFAVTMIYSF